MNTKYTLKLLQFFIFFSLILSVYGQDQVSDDKLSDDIPSTTLTETPKEEAPKEEAPKEETPKEEAPKEETPKEEAPKEETPKAEATDEKEASVEESTGIAKLFGIIISILFGAVVILIVWNIFWPSALVFFTLKNDANEEHNESENIQEDEFVKNKNVEVVPCYTGIIFNDTQDNDTQDNKEKIFYLIKKDTPIPCSKTETLYTMVDNQTSMQLKIVQSPAEIYDFEMVKVISESTIEIPAGSPAATPVNITLTYTEDGTLNCSAEIEIPASKKVINLNTGVEDEELPKTSEDDKADQNSTINEKEEKSVANGDDDLTKQLKNVVLKKIAEWLNKLNASINTINKKSEAGFKKIEKETSELVMATAKLNSVIENQQKEIERYKKGYDYSIRKDSFTPLLQLDDLIKNILNEPDINEQTIKKLNSVEKYISSYLEERDIESFEFEVGKSYRDLPADEFEIEEIVDTDDQKFNEKIERIIKEGYCNIHPNGKNILRKVKISVYKYKGE